MKKTETKKAKAKATVKRKPKPKLVPIDKAVLYFINLAKEVHQDTVMQGLGLDVLGLAAMLQKEAHNQGFKITEDLLHTAGIDIG